ncbi:MAG: T9SS type A sorting domain-containing protein [bacterium]
MKNHIKLMFLYLLFSQSFAYSQDYLAPGQTGYFLENRGQWNSEVRFLNYSKSFDTWICKDYLIFDIQSVKEVINVPDNNCARYDDKNTLTVIERNPVKLKFVGAKTSNFKFYDADIYNTYFNYFFGSDSSQWITELYPKKSIFVENLYDGIGIRYYIENSNLRYDFIIEPGSNPEIIEMSFEGHESIDINKYGELCIKTKIGSFKQCGLYAYQLINKKEVPVECSMNISVNGNVNFKLGKYNKSETLIIDPLIYSLALYGHAPDYITGGIENDRFDNTYICGTSRSTDFPITEQYFIDSVHTTTYVFLSKINPDGTKLLYSTFIGCPNKNKKNGTDAVGFKLGPDNTSYICANTFCNDFPLSEDAYSKNFPIGSINDYVAFAVDSTGTRLTFSTFLNLPKSAGTSGIDIDYEGNIYLAGSLDENGLPITENAIKKEYQADSNGMTWQDAYILKLNLTGSKILFCTYFGGIDHNEVVLDFDVDSTGNVYITGHTQSEDFPYTENAFQKVPFPNVDNPFIAKINTNNGELVYSTMVGSTGQSMVFALGTTSDGCAIIGGFTESFDFPGVENGYFNVNPDNVIHAFVVKLNADGSNVIASAHLGGRFFSRVEDIVIDYDGYLIVSGRTESSDFPITEDAFQKELKGKEEIFFCEFSPGLKELLYSSFLGGSNTDAESIVTVDKKNNIIIGGLTISHLDFPLTNSEFYFKGQDESFIAKFDILTGINDFISNDNEIEIFPNPINSNQLFNIIFHIVNTSNIEVDLVNNMGINVAEIFSGFKESGSHSIQFKSPLGIASGLYWVRLIIDGNEQIVKPIMMIE